VLPDGQDPARVWRPRDPAALRARLGDAPLAAWSDEEDILDVLWRGGADQVELGAGVQLRQEWVGGHDNYWWDQQLPVTLAWLLAPP
jgi:hypothetical protein